MTPSNSGTTHMQSPKRDLSSSSIALPPALIYASALTCGVLAALALQKNDRARAIAELTALVAIDFDNVDAARRLAALLRQTNVDDPAKLRPEQKVNGLTTVPLLQVVELD